MIDIFIRWDDVSFFGSVCEGPEDQSIRCASRHDATVSEVKPRGERAVQQTAASPTNILVVEDEHLIRLFIRIALEEVGFHVELATTANEARQRFQRSTADFHAAIIDVGLPDNPGDELAQEIRRIRPNLPIIIATGLRENVFAERFADDPKLRA